MFDTLIESGVRPRASAGGGVVSLAVHASIVALAVVATWNHHAVPGVMHAPIPVELPPWPVVEAPSVSASSGDPEPAPSAPVPVAIDVPTMPAIDFSPTSLPNAATELRRAIRQALGQPTIATGNPHAPGSGDASIHLAGEVDEPVTVVATGRLRYPPALEAAGITGRVAIEFVVDTLGAVEPASLRVIEASHSGFVPPATTAVLATRFTPARARGVLVRQLARQSMVFRIQH